jgi:hypothetical protein
MIHLRTGCPGFNPARFRSRQRIGSLSWWFILDVGVDSHCHPSEIA